MRRERWLVTGASGQLGGHIVRQLASDDAEPEIMALAGRGDVGTPGVAVQHVDLRQADVLRRCVAEFRPSHVVHAGAMTSVAEAYQRPQEAWVTNAEATLALGEAGEDVGARFVFISTDMVFGGDAAPYRETDSPNPLSNYGRTKFFAERLVLLLDRALVVRLPLMYGFAVTRRETTFADQIAALRERKPLTLFTDEFRTPVWIVDAARAVVGLGRSEQAGLIHVAGPQRLSRHEMVATFAKVLHIANPLLEAISRLSIATAEPRPADLSLKDGVFRGRFPSLSPKPISEITLVETST